MQYVIAFIPHPLMVTLFPCTSNDFCSELFAVEEKGRKFPVILKLPERDVPPSHTVKIMNPERSRYGNRPDVDSMDKLERQQYHTSNRQRAHRLRVKEYV